MSEHKPQPTMSRSEIRRRAIQNPDDLVQRMVTVQEERDALGAERDKLKAALADLQENFDTLYEASEKRGDEANRYVDEIFALRAERDKYEAVAVAAVELMPVARACIASPRKPLTKLHITLRACGLLGDNHAD